MKKLLCVLLTAMMALGLVACGGSPASSEAAPAADAASENENTASGDVTTVNAGKLTMATSPDFPPYEKTDDDGNVVGIEIDIMEKIAEKLGLELQIDAMEFDSALLAVEQGKSDMAVSGITVTDERKLVMNFTDSYTTAVQVIIVPEGSDVTADNLGEHLIGTQRGTTGYIYTLDDYGEDHVVGYDTYSTVIQSLLNGQVDCVVMDDAVAQEFVDANPGLTILETAYADENYAFAVNKENEALTNAVNDALNELMDDGTVDAIINEWIGE